MVETEKVCNHKISTTTTTHELVQRTKSVGDNSSNAVDEENRGVATTPGGTKSRRGHHGKEDGVTFARSNTIATGNKKSISTSGGESGKGQRPSLERSVSAYYVFSSLPQVVHNVRPKTGYRNNVSRPRGAHDYFNVMWDPHIYRGTTTTLTSSLKQPDATDLSTNNSNRDQQDRYRRRRAFLQGSQNTFNTSTNTLAPVGGVGGGGHTTTIRSNRYRMTTKVTSRSRTFPPPEGRHQVHVQTEEYLEDLSRDMVKGPEVDAVVQTDPIEDEELLSSPLINIGSTSGGEGDRRRKVLPVATGVDASTQVLPGELITFDEQVQPVVEAVVGKILEQALLETMEEEEIGALKAQQNRFLEKRKEEERELKRLQEQQERISAEKERLKRHLEMQFKQRQVQQQQQQENGDAGGGSVEETEGDVLITETAGGNGNNNNGMLSTAYLLELLPSVLNSLRQEGFLLEDGDDIMSSYITSWHQSSTSSKPDDENSNCVSRINSLEQLAASAGFESSTAQQEQDEEGEMDGEAEGNQDNASENGNAAEENEAVVADDSVEQLAAEITTEQDEQVENEAQEVADVDTVEEEIGENTEADEQKVPNEEGENREDETEEDNVSPEDNPEEKSAAENNEDIAEQIEAAEENTEDPQNDEDAPASETSDVSTAPPEKEEEPEEDEEEGKNSNNEAADNETGTEVQPDAASTETEGLPESSTSPLPPPSSQKLPNGAIPNMS